MAVAQDDDCGSCDEDEEEFMLHHANDAINDIKDDVKFVKDNEMS